MSSCSKDFFTFGGDGNVSHNCSVVPAHPEWWVHWVGSQSRNRKRSPRIISTIQVSHGHSCARGVKVAVMCS